MVNNDLLYIKRHYSEKLAQICRTLFPQILEIPGKLTEIITTHFAPSANLGDDVESNIDGFRSYIFSFFEKEKPIETASDLSAVELFDQAEYILYPECKTESDIQSFRYLFYRGDDISPKYTEGQEIVPSKGEELCTFKGDRLYSRRVWFAVKKDVDKIKREEFLNPQREDKYATSVISIQSHKNDIYLYITNRYNDFVKNADNTYYSNLDNIKPGLQRAFERDYGLELKKRDYFQLDNYVCAPDGKYYRYNFEANGIYYCENNVIIWNAGVEQIDKTKYILADNIVIDIPAKKISVIDNGPYYYDCIDKIYKNIDKIDVRINSDTKEREIIIYQPNKTPVIMRLNKYNEITFLRDDNIVECGDGFLHESRSLIELIMPNLQSCGDKFLFRDRVLKKYDLSKLKSCGSYFVYKNKTELNLSLQKPGPYFKHNNTALEELNEPSIEQ